MPVSLPKPVTKADFTVNGSVSADISRKLAKKATEAKDQSAS
jgi:hypothetical protein